MPKPLRLLIIVTRPRSRRRSIRSCLVSLTALVWASSVLSAAAPATAGADDALNPIGSPKVLVIMFRYPLPACPDAGKKCPGAAYESQVTEPILSATQWSTLLNGQVRDFYDATSYGQTRPEFTVPKNPNRSDGWWRAPQTYQAYWNGTSPFHATKGGPGQGDDALAQLIPQMIAAKALTWAQFRQFSRYLIITNAHYHGGMSTGKVLSFYDTPLGKRAYTGTLLDEIEVFLAGEAAQ